MLDLSTGARKTVFGSAVVSALIAIAVTADLFLTYPYSLFGGSAKFDLVFLLSAGLVLYMAYDTWHELPTGSTTALVATATRRSHRTSYARQQQSRQAVPAHTARRRSGASGQPDRSGSSAARSARLSV